MNLHDKLILSDVDGVMLAWEHAFDEWMYRKGHRKQREDVYGMDECYGIESKEAGDLITMFNQTAWLGYISPFRDAVKYVKKLHEEHGFVFRCITSFEQDMYSVRLREMNLHNTFGRNVFESIHCIGNEDKAHYLKPYEDTGCVWLEDKPSNCEKGVNAGLNTFIFDHPYNQEYDNPNVTRIKTWRNLYEAIT